MTENNEITENIQSANMNDTTENGTAMEAHTQEAPATEEAHATEEASERRSHHTRPQDGHGRYFVVRQILNLLFMVIALVGVGLYLWWNEMGGIIIVIIAMAFKMAECVLRYLK